MKKNKVTVQIFGESYALKSDTDEQRVKQVAELLDKNMHIISQANPGLSGMKVAVLSALNILEEHLKLKNDYDQLLNILKEEKKAW